MCTYLLFERLNKTAMDEIWVTFGRPDWKFDAENGELLDSGTYV